MALIFRARRRGKREVRATPKAAVRPTRNRLRGPLRSLGASTLLGQTDALDMRLEADGEHGASELTCDAGCTLAAGELAQQLDVLGSPKSSFTTDARHDNPLNL